MDKERIEQILKKIGSAEVPAEIEKMSEMAASEFSRELKTRPERKQVWEIIMRSRLIKLAVAACVILGVGAGIYFFGGGGTSVALADVLQKVEQAQAFMYKLRMNMTGNMQPGMPSGPVEMTATVLISNEYGMKMDTDTNTVVNGVSRKMRQIMYMLPQEKKMYMVLPEQKQYIQMEFDETIVERMKKQSNDPREFLGKIVNSKYTDIGKSVIDGVEVEGFQTTDPAVVGGMMEEVKVTLWVDRKTELPVREEMYYKINEQMQMDGELYDFQWNVTVNADEFKPVIPQDYKTPLPAGFKLPSMNEETAIEGLKFFLDNTGKYPEKLNILTMTKDAETIFRQKEDVNNLPTEVRTQKLIDAIRPVQSLVGFYMMQVQNKKEPAYYGEVVGPADADKVLMRWKVSDTEYRVIYGDLKAETVSAERLAELESKLPK